MNINYDHKKVLFLDLDGTLINTISGKDFAEDCSDFQINLPLLHSISTLMPDLEYVFIVTNQGGLGTFFEQYELEAKLYAVVAFMERYFKEFLPMLERLDYEYCASMNPGDPRRKPNTKMLTDMLFSYTGYDESSEEDRSKMLMIGDASGKPNDFSDSDKKCAEYLDIDYIDVRDFILT